MMNNNSLKEIARVVKKAKSIALFTHMSPDCDALGSVYGLYYSLKQLKKDVTIFTKDNYTAVEKILFDEALSNKEACDYDKYDLFISCDTPTFNMLGEYSDVFHQKENRIMLDHHQKTMEIGKYNYIDSTRSSCCEIVFDLLKVLKVQITPQIASGLYVGLSSDTNSFVNSNTTQNSFNTAKELIELGADIGKLNETLYSMRTRKSLVFKKYLWNNFKIKGDCAYCLMPYKELMKLEGEKSDCVGFSHSLVTIQGINYGFSIIEFPQGFYQISLRSKIGYDVRKVAEKIGGGGHTCASGARFYAKNMTEAKNKVLNAIKEY